MSLASGGFYADGLKGVFDSTRRYEPASGAELCGWAEKCVRQQRNPAAGGFDNKKRPTGQSLISLFFHYRSFMF